MMKLVAGTIIAAGLLASAATAQAPAPAPYVIEALPDVGEPLTAGEMAPREGPPEFAPLLLPAREIYAIARDNGFAPLGRARRRGLVYTLSVIDPDGEHGRLAVDARTGRIRRFTPAHRMSVPAGRDFAGSRRSADGWPSVNMRRPPRPPASIPDVATPLSALAPPRAAPHRVTAASRQAGAPKSPTAPRSASTHAAVGGPVTPAGKPAAEILPTQEMPAVQGLE